jgi:hypothetical protein
MAMRRAAVLRQCVVVPLVVMDSALAGCARAPE